MLKMVIAKILENKKIGNSIYIMALEAKELVCSSVPGQFIEIYLDKGEHILPRPISILKIDKRLGIMYIVYQVVGKGTKHLSHMQTGESIRITGNLGNGFPVEKRDNYAIIGGGIGIPPLFFLCQNILETKPDAKITVFLGFRSETFLTQEFKELGVDVLISTDDGSCGTKGNVLNLIKESSFKPHIIYSCGPKIMLNKISRYALEKDIQCYISVEERMACGFGACVGCAVKISDPMSQQGFKYKKVCKDGPIFDCKEVLWDE